MANYGYDEYSRFVEVDGERYAIEPYPYRNLWHKFLARIDIAKWYLHYGWRNYDPEDGDLHE